MPNTLLNSQTFFWNIYIQMNEGGGLGSNNIRDKKIGILSKILVIKHKIRLGSA